MASLFESQVSELSDVMVDLAGLTNGRAQQSTVSTGPAILTDHGGIVYRQPAIIVQPTNAADIAGIFQYAQKYNLPVSFRGAGHTCRGQSLCEGGITILNPLAAPDFRLLDDHRIEVTTRTNWERLTAALSPLALMPRVLTSHLGVSLGGTLSAGGYGLQSVTFGGQIDQVEKLLLIKPDGDAVWCSPNENPLLFAYSLGGFGQVGYIEKVVMHVRPKPDSVRWYLYRHASLDALISSISWLENIPPGTLYGFSAIFHLHDSSALSLYGIEAANKVAFIQQLPTELRFASYRRVGEPPVFRGDRLPNDRQPPFCPAADYLLPYDQLASFLHRLNELWSENQLHAYAPTCLLHAIRPSPSHWHPLAAASFGDPHSMKYLVGIYPIVPANEPETLATIRYVLNQLLMACIVANGRPYLYGWHELTTEMKQQLYGKSYDTWQSLCQEVDPNGILKRSL